MFCKISFKVIQIEKSNTAIKFFNIFFIYSSILKIRNLILSKMKERIFLARKK